MTRKSRNQNRSESIVPSRTNEVTPDRRVFEYELYETHDNLVRSWVQQLVPKKLRETIDTEQLKLMILLELLETLRNRVDEVHIDRSETIPLSWTIADHHAKVSVQARLTGFSAAGPGGLARGLAQH